MSIFDSDSPFAGIDLLAPKVPKERKPKSARSTSTSSTPAAPTPTRPRRLEIHLGTPQAFIQVVRVQCCALCGSETHFVGEELVEFEDERLRVKHWRGMETIDPAHETWLRTQIAERIHTEHSEVEECAQCLYLRYFSAGVELEPASPLGQATLWGDSQ